MVDKIKYHVEEECKSMLTTEQSDPTVADEMSVNYAQIGVRNIEALHVLRERKDC